MDRRALYHSLRLYYMQDPELQVEPWQVEDYRSLELDELFTALGEIGLTLDKAGLMALAEETESPEDLADALADELDISDAQADHLYLILFELWRRLVPQKQTMSLFCDELDTQITLYDQDRIEHPDSLEDTISNLLYLLNEQVDEGDSPQELFGSIKNCLANDLESFLYDFIAERIDLGNTDYAAELLDGFNDYIEDPKWFALLKSRLLKTSDPDEASQLIQKLIGLTETENDVEFDLELLSLLVHEGDKKAFSATAQRALEEELDEGQWSDLLDICEEYYHYIDREKEAGEIAILGDLPLEEGREKLLAILNK